MKNETPTDANNVLADSSSIKDLIHLDISRCNDDRCPTAPFCERYLQMAIDYKKGEKLVSVTDFKGREKVGLCDHFLMVFTNV
jgi:23S rRNA U2552 (ribose-2'-O)-methylase RlmE/FtsJ